MKYLLTLVVVLIFISKVTAQINNVGIGTINPDSSAKLEIYSTSKGLLIPRLTSAQRMAIQLPAAGLQVYQTNELIGIYYFDGANWTRIQEGSKHYIGELLGGGIVFWVDENGNHGLILSLVDISTSTAWSNITNVQIGLSAQSTWNGQGNTNAIIGQSGHTGSGAKLCDDYTNADYGTGIFSDWYLPSMDQMNLIFTYRYEINKIIESYTSGDLFSDEFYWTSREHNADEAFFIVASSFSAEPKNALFSVRAIREF